MAERRPYKVLHGKHGRWEDGKFTTYRPGDTMYLTEAEAKGLSSAKGSMVEPLSVAEPPRAKTTAPAPEPKAETAGVADEDLADMHWSQAAKAISELETADEVRAARAEEAAGKARKGVLKAADERLAELDEDISSSGA